MRFCINKVNFEHERVPYGVERRGTAVKFNQRLGASPIAASDMQRLVQVANNVDQELERLGATRLIGRLLEDLREIMDGSDGAYLVGTVCGGRVLAYCRRRIFEGIQVVERAGPTIRWVPLNIWLSAGYYRPKKLLPLVRPCTRGAARWPSRRLQDQGTLGRCGPRASGHRCRTLQFGHREGRRIAAYVAVSAILR